MTSDSQRTRLAWWRDMGGLTNERLGEMLGRSYEQARRNCLPRGHADHRRIGAAPSDRLMAITHGLVHAGNYAELITEDEAAAMMAEYQARACLAGSAPVAHEPGSGLASQAGSRASRDEPGSGLRARDCSPEPAPCEAEGRSGSNPS